MIHIRQLNYQQSNINHTFNEYLNIVKFNI